MDNPIIKTVKKQVPEFLGNNYRSKLVAGKIQVKEKTMKPTGNDIQKKN